MNENPSFSWGRVGIIVLIILGSLLIGSLLTLLAGFAMGYDLENLTGFLDNLQDPVSRNKTRIFLMINHLFTFILPAIVIALVLSKNSAVRYLTLQKRPTYINVALGVLFVLVAYPFVQKSFEWNAMLPLPDWMMALETDTNDSIKGLLKMDHLGEFLLNLLVIAIIPGIGEELLFRGVIQKELYRLFQRPAIAVWIAAILFSAMHLQFQGFFPRLLLGATLGYLYLFTKNLWIPIIVHFINNAIPIVGMYVFSTDLTDLGIEDTEHMPTLVAIGSLLLTIGLGIHISQRNKVVENVQV